MRITMKRKKREGERDRGWKKLTLLESLAKILQSGEVLGIRGLGRIANFLGNLLGLLGEVIKSLLPLEEKEKETSQAKNNPAER